MRDHTHARAIENRDAKAAAMFPFETGNPVLQPYAPIIRFADDHDASVITLSCQSR